MATLTYPRTLPCPQTSVVTPAERRALSNADRPREARNIQRDRLDYERITWPPLDATKAETILVFWRDTLQHGGAWFVADWPIPRGLHIPTVRKFREQPKWQFVPGGFWQLSALCEVRGRGELPFYSVWLEEFERGMGRYVVVSGDGTLFTLIPSTYGNSLHVASQSSSEIARIERVLDEPLTNVNHVQVKFMVESIASDDASGFGLLDGATYVFSLNPVREAAFDGARRSYLLIDGETLPVTTSVIEAAVWYQLDVTIASGGGTVCRITNASSGALIAETVFALAHDPIAFDRLSFQVDSSGLTCPTLYDEIDADSVELGQISATASMTLGALTVASTSTLDISGALTMTLDVLSVASAADQNDPYYSSVSLLCHCDGSNGGTTFTDNSSSPKTVVVHGNVNTSTAQFKFGTASALFDGTTDYLTVVNGAYFDLGTGDFTIELWVRTTNVAVQQVFFDMRATGATTLGAFGITSSGILYFYLNSGQRITGSAISGSTWHHVALSRVSGTTRLFLNGTQEGSSYTDSLAYNGMVATVGADYTGGQSTIGNIDDARVTKGVGRYAATFTPTGAAFPNS